MINLDLLKDTRLVRLLAAIINRQLDIKGYLVIGNQEINTTLVNVTVLAKEEDKKKVILDLARRLIRKYKSECLDFIRKYLDENSLFSGSKNFYLNGKTLEVQIKDYVYYPEYYPGYEKREIPLLITPEFGNKFTVEIPKAVQIDIVPDSVLGLDYSYKEIKKEIFVETGHFVNYNNEVTPGIVVASINKVFVLSPENSAEFEKQFEIMGFVCIDQKEDKPYFVPQFKVFGGTYLLYTEFVFFKGLFKVLPVDLS